MRLLQAGSCQACMRCSPCTPERGNNLHPTWGLDNEKETHQEHCKLLINAAQTHDSRTKNANGGTIKKHQVHELLLDQGVQADEPLDSNDDLDANDIVRAFSTKRTGQQHDPGSHMPWTIWQQLSKEHQGIWDQLDNKAKLIALSGVKKES